MKTAQVLVSGLFVLTVMAGGCRKSGNAGSGGANVAVTPKCAWPDTLIDGKCVIIPGYWRGGPDNYPFNDWMKGIVWVSNIHNDAIKHPYLAIYLPPTDDEHLMINAIDGLNEGGGSGVGSIPGPRNYWPDPVSGDSVHFSMPPGLRLWGSYMLDYRGRMNLTYDTMVVTMSYRPTASNAAARPPEKGVVFYKIRAN